MGKKTSTTTQQVTIPPEVMARYRAVNERAEKVANNPFQLYSQDPNAFVAPINATQYGAIGDIANAGSYMPQFFNAATGYTSAGASPVNPQGLDIGQFFNPFTSMVANATAAGLKQQQGEQMQGAIGDAIKNGAFGGDRAGIGLANLARQQELGYSQAMAPIWQQGFQQALGAAQQQQGVQLGADQANAARMLQAGQQFAGLGTGLQGAELQRAQALLGAGTLEQQTEQGGKQALYNQFLQQQGYPFQVAQFLANIAMGTGALSGSTTTTQQPAPFFSDRRLKHDIRRIGETDDGMPIYKFKYKNDPQEQTHIGFMADEVERHHPEAVGLASGYKTVDYDAATERTHKAGGGALGFDQDFLSKILSNHAAMYGQAPGAPRGATGMPGATGRVPAASLPVGRLMTAGSAPQQQQSGLAQAAQTGSQIASLVDMAGKAKDALTDGKGISSLWSGKSNSSSPAATGPLDLLRGSRDKSLDEDQIGRGYAMGGEVDISAPEGLYTPIDGINIPDERQKHELAVAGKPPDAPKSGLSSIMDIAKTAAAVAGMFADGGAVQPDDDELAVRTIMSEMGRGKRGEYNPQEALAIASVINNRAKARGLTPGDVVLEQGQFEPWSKPGAKNDPMNHDVNSPEFKSVHGLWMRARNGEDPTGGANHFWGPASQAALGRPNPDFSYKAPGVDIGASRFHNVPGYGGNETVGAGPRQPIGEDPRASMAAPGLAGPGRGPKDAESSPFRYFAENLLKDSNMEGKTKSALTSENLWVPLLSGLGSMLASRSPYLGNAIGEGLVGGTKAYTDLNTQQQNIAESRMRTEEGAARIADSAWRTTDGRLMLRYVRKDGTYGVISASEYNALSPEERSQYKIDPRAAQIAATEAGRGSSAPGAPTPQTPALPQPPTTAGGSTAPTVVAPKPALPPPTEPTKPVQMPGQPATPASPFGPMPHEISSPNVVQPPQSIGGIDLTPGERTRAATVTQEKSSWGEERRNREPDFFTPQEAIAKANETQRQLILPLAGTLASLPREKSIYTSGKFQEVVSPIMGTLNNLAAIAGVPGLISNPESLAKQEEVRKLTNQLKQAATSETQQRAFAAFQEMAEGLPGILNSPGGQAKLIAQTMINNQREIDRNNYFENWKNAAAGERRQNAEWVRLSSREANQEFDKTFNRPMYARESQALERMFNDTVKIEGKDVPVLEIISMRPQLLTPKRKEQLEREYGKGILRYFGVN